MGGSLSFRGEKKKSRLSSPPLRGEKCDFPRCHPNLPRPCGKASLPSCKGMRCNGRTRRKLLGPKPVRRRRSRAFFAQAEGRAFSCPRSLCLPLSRYSSRSLRFTAAIVAYGGGDVNPSGKSKTIGLLEGRYSF